MGFTENLRLFRSNKGLTQKSLGNTIGVTSVTIGNWERGVRQPSFDLLIKLADALDTSIDSLLGRYIRTSISASDKRAEDFLNKYKRLDSHGKNVVETICAIELDRISPKTNVVVLQNNHVTQEQPRKRYLPFYTSPSAAGIAAPLEGNDFEMLLVDDSVPEDADYAVRISGDSMEPYIQDGTMVYVKESSELSEGDIGIFCVNGEMYCKQYFIDDNGDLNLLSANQNRSYANVKIPQESEYSVKCCGKVLLGFSIPLPDYIFHEND